MQGLNDISKPFEKYFSGPCKFQSERYICHKNLNIQMAKQQKKARNIYFTDDQWKKVQAAAAQEVTEASPFVARTILKILETRAK